MSTSYAGPSVASAFAVGVINDAWSAVAELEGISDGVKSKITSYKKPVVYPPTMQPLLAIGDLANTVVAISANAHPTADRAAIVADIATDARSFFKTYFLDSLDGTTAYDDAVSWINTMLANGGSGVPYEAKLRTADVQRISRDGLRALADVNSSWVARGSPLPSRVTDFQARRIGYITGDALGDAERAARIKSFGAEVANTQWSMERSFKLRTDAFDDCRAFVVDWMKVRYDEIKDRYTEQTEFALAVQSSFAKMIKVGLEVSDTAVDKYLARYDTDAAKWKTKEEFKDLILKAAYLGLQTQMQALATRAAAAINSIHVSAAATGSEVL